MDLEVGQVLTQIVAFLIMLWILKKFAWKPLLGLMDERQKKIRDAFDDIDKQKKDLQALAQQYQDQLHAIDQLAHQKIQIAVQEGRKIAAEIQAQSKEEARSFLDQMKQEMEREVAQSKMRLKNDLVVMTIEATQKMIQETLTAEKQQELINYFAEHMDFK